MNDALGAETASGDRSASNRKISNISSIRLQPISVMTENMPLKPYMKPTLSWLELDPDQTLQRLDRKRELSGRARSMRTFGI
jgi:hypothetical protein